MEPLANLPSESWITDQTQLVCPFSVCFSTPEIGSHNLIVPGTTCQSTSHQMIICIDARVASGLERVPILFESIQLFLFSCHEVNLLRQVVLSVRQDILTPFITS